jgi:hypothetical protein
MSGGEASTRCNEAINELAKVRNVSSLWCCLHLHYRFHNPHYFHDPQYLSLPSNSIKLTVLPLQYAKILDSLLLSSPILSPKYEDLLVGAPLYPTQVRNIPFVSPCLPNLILVGHRRS